MNNNYLSNIIKNVKDNAIIYGGLGVLALTTSCSCEPRQRLVTEFEDLIGTSYVEAKKTVIRGESRPNYQIKETREDESIITYNDTGSDGTLDGCNIKKPEGAVIYPRGGTLLFHEAQRRYTKLRDTIPEIKKAYAAKIDSLNAEKYFR